MIQSLLKYTFSFFFNESLLVRNKNSTNVDVVKHNYSYNSLDCSLKLNSKLYQDFKVSRKISRGWNNLEAIVINVLGKKELEIRLKDLKQYDPPLYFCLQIDIFHHKNKKNILVCVRYFNIEYDAVNYIIDFFRMLI